jgi:hypothetical protein
MQAAKPRFSRKNRGFFALALDFSVISALRRPRKVQFAGIRVARGRTRQQGAALSGDEKT